MNRPSWDVTWYDIAYTIGQRSRCTHARIGAVIVDPQQRIVATGYNGPPALWDTDCADCSGFCPRSKTLNPADRDSEYLDCVAIHAEMNALMFADRRQVEGGTLYVTSAVCYTCAKAVANSGIQRVVANWADGRHRDPARVMDFLSGMLTVDDIVSVLR